MRVGFHKVLYIALIDIFKLAQTLHSRLLRKVVQPLLQPNLRTQQVVFIREILLAKILLDIADHHQNVAGLVMSFAVVSLEHLQASFQVLQCQL